MAELSMDFHDKTYKFQLFSDIHIENYKTFPKIKPLTPHLFLAGDIGCFKPSNMTNGTPEVFPFTSSTATTLEDVNLRGSNANFVAFFDYCSENWEKVFYVLGNHEYYHKTKTMDELYINYNSFFKNRYTNVYLLCNSSVDIDENLCVYGATLWTNPTTIPNVYRKIFINDYTNIQYMDETRKIRFITPEYISMYSCMEKEFLENFLHHNTKKVIIMTHFPPTQNGTSSPEYADKGNFLKNYYAWSDLLESIDTKNIACWISGHTHWSYDFSEEVKYLQENKDVSKDTERDVSSVPLNFSVKDVRLLSNQMGYMNDQNNFSENGVFEI